MKTLIVSLILVVFTTNVALSQKTNFEQIYFNSIQATKMVEIDGLTKIYYFGEHSVMVTEEKGNWVMYWDNLSANICKKNLKISEPRMILDNGVKTIIFEISHSKCKKSYVLIEVLF